jgi:hypothetical protein
MDWGAMFHTLPVRYRKGAGRLLGVPYCLERQWIGEGKTVRQMMDSLLNEPIRKAVELM